MKFYKYTGAGNDFILFNDMTGEMPVLSSKQVQFLCDRHFGVGADGVMILKKSKALDFDMEYFNADGSGGTMCGNGGRCLVAFAQKSGIIEKHTKFLASDGVHEAFINQRNIVKLKMIDVDEVKSIGKDFYCYTGSPHYIIFVDDIEVVDVCNEGRKIRYSDTYKNEGTNVNFVKIEENHSISIRTYERGVEDETLSCGTGAVASALVSAIVKHLASPIKVLTKGGEVTVWFRFKEEKFSDVFLEGEANAVYKGYLNGGKNV